MFLSRLGAINCFIVGVNAVSSEGASAALKATHIVHVTSNCFPILIKQCLDLNVHFPHMAFILRISFQTNHLINPILLI